MQHNSQNNKKLNAHVTEQASLLRDVLYSSCLVPCIYMYVWFVYTTEKTWKAYKASNYVLNQSEQKPGLHATSHPYYVQKDKMDLVCEIISHEMSHLCIYFLIKTCNRIHIENRPIIIHKFHVSCTRPNT
jgi:hypothetical protein